MRLHNSRNPARDRQIIERLQAGVHAEILAREHGVSESRIYQIACRAGAGRPPRPRGNGVTNESLLQSMLQDQASQKAIAACSAALLARLIEVYGPRGRHA